MGQSTATRIRVSTRGIQRMTGTEQLSPVLWKPSPRTPSAGAGKPKLSVMNGWRVSVSASERGQLQGDSVSRIPMILWGLFIVSIRETCSCAQGEGERHHFEICQKALFLTSLLSEAAHQPEPDRREGREVPAPAHSSHPVPPRWGQWSYGECRKLIVERERLTNQDLVLVLWHASPPPTTCHHFAKGIFSEVPFPSTSCLTINKELQHILRLKTKFEETCKHQDQTQDMARISVLPTKGSDDKSSDG